MKKLSDAVADAIASASKSIVRLERSSGIAWAADVVITSAHSLRSDDNVIGWDPATDVAVLRASGLTPIAWSDDELRVGNFVVVAGHSTRATFGIISALDDFIEVDAALPHGFSGGPLVDLDGRAIGMNTSRVRRNGTTIPVATLRRVVNSILEHGAVRRAFLGVGVHPVEGGVIVLSLAPDGRIVPELVETLLVPVGAPTVGPASRFASWLARGRLDRALTALRHRARALDAGPQGYLSLSAHDDLRDAMHGMLASAADGYRFELEWRSLFTELGRGSEAASIRPVRPTHPPAGTLHCVYRFGPRAIVRWTSTPSGVSRDTLDLPSTDCRSEIAAILDEISKQDLSPASHARLHRLAVAGGEVVEGDRQIAGLGQAQAGVGADVAGGDLGVTAGTGGIRDGSDVRVPAVSTCAVSLSGASAACSVGTGADASRSESMTIR